jgi:hypothetical protein
MIKPEHILNSHFLKSLYPEGIKGTVQISDINFHYDGPSAKVTFHFQQMPVEVPKKWQAKEFNAFALVLGFSDIKNLSFTNWGTQNYVEVKIEKEMKTFDVSFQGEDCEFSFSCGFISFKTISPYLTE